jgi:hypothetical protein
MPEINRILLDRNGTYNMVVFVAGQIAGFTPILIPIAADLAQRIIHTYEHTEEAYRSMTIFDFKKRIKHEQN